MGILLERRRRRERDFDIIVSRKQKKRIRFGLVTKICCGPCGGMLSMLA